MLFVPLHAYAGYQELRNFNNIIAKFIIFAHADAITHTLFQKDGIIIDISVSLLHEQTCFTKAIKNKSMKQLHRTLSFFSLVTLTACAFSTTSCSKGSDDNPPGNDKETVIFTDNFDNAGSSFWQPGTNGLAVKTVSGGFFSLKYGGTSPWMYKTWSSKKLFGADDKKQAVEISQQHVAGHKYDKGGLIFAVKDVTYILGFQVGEKEFRVYSEINGTTKQLIDWKPSSAIKGALNEVNKLRIALADGKLTFYINGTEVGVLEAGGITSLDYVGYDMVKGDALETTYKVDYIKAMTLK
jgi:hypothetical protein